MPSVEHRDDAHDGLLRGVLEAVEGGAQSLARGREIEGLLTYGDGQLAEHGASVLPELGRGGLDAKQLIADVPLLGGSGVELAEQPRQVAPAETEAPVTTKC